MRRPNWCCPLHVRSSRRATQLGCKVAATDTLTAAALAASTKLQEDNFMGCGYQFEPAEWWAEAARRSMPSERQVSRRPESPKAGDGGGTTGEVCRAGARPSLGRQQFSPHGGRYRQDTGDAVHARNANATAPGPAARQGQSPLHGSPKRPRCQHGPVSHAYAERQGHALTKESIGAKELSNVTEARTPSWT